MAEYYQVFETSQGTPESYSHIIDTEGVKYIIQTNDDTPADQVSPLVVVNPSSVTQPVFLVESPLKETIPNMQPVVLNHSLQCKVLSPQLNQLRPPQRMPRPQTNAGQLLNNRLPQPRSMATNDTGMLNGDELIKLEDGRLMTIDEYQKYVAQKKNAGIMGSVNHGASHLGVRPTGRPTYRTKSPQVKSPSPVAPPTALVLPNKATGRIIKPNPNMPLPKILRDFVAPAELLTIIQRSNDEEFENSIRMFVLLKCGEQRLITFTTPKDDCTIHEILEQVGVPLEPTTPIYVKEAKNTGLDFIVSVGFEDNKDLQVAKSSVLTPDSSPEQPPEEPHYIPGKMAVCPHCGYISEDFNKCQRCKRKMPVGIKQVGVPTTGKALVRKPGIAINLKSPVGSVGANQGSTGSSSSLSSKASAMSSIARAKRIRPKLVEQEPTIVTLSSDDEESTPKKQVKKSDFVPEPTADEITNNTVVLNNTTHILACTTLCCRMIRIGSYKFSPTDDVMINGKELVIKARHVTDKDLLVYLPIARQYILKVFVSFQKTLPAVLYYLTPTGGTKVRQLLGMTKETEEYYDPTSSNEIVRRLILLPHQLNESDKWVFQTIYGTLMEEITLAQVNDILIKSCPNDVEQIESLMNNNRAAQPTTDVQQLFIYPPGKGGIGINTEDYMCLERDQFLNDVIIDFYLKYVLNQLSDEQQSRVHVFSTFFYKRLTTKSVKVVRKSLDTEGLLSAAQKRHLKVKNWTKNIDLFEKDFIIVPINENAHWFLAIICFPGMTDACTFDGVRIKLERPKSGSRKQTANTKTAVIAAQTPKVQKEKLALAQVLDEDSDKDEAEGDENEFDIEETEDTVSANATITPVPIKQPSILIFDSLSGMSRARVVATLRDYLTCEYASKKNKTRIFTKDNILGSCPKVPQQNNFTDCGLYVLQYVEQFFIDPIKDYRIPIKGLNAWFDESVVTKKREDIANIIKDLMTQYNKDLSILPCIDFPSENEENAAEENETEEMEVDKAAESGDDPMQSHVSDDLVTSKVAVDTRQNAMSYLKAKRIIKSRSEALMAACKKLRGDKSEH